MSNTVDNRVVEMKFNNAAFEKKMSATIASLSKLQQSLEKTGQTKGLEDLGRAAKNFNLGGMATKVEGVSKSFLAMSAIAITALSNITNRAVDAGIRIVKSLSFDQVSAGFQEYETNMKSIQTILANTKAKGTILADVEGALDNLNEYADQTIYNFAEMARNIGTFTAAGVDLDTAQVSIKGIANAAAISGSTSQQASTAMYQLSQAIASGSLKLMDWNSVVNAGMGGEVMQKALFDTGKAMGTLTGVDLDTTFNDWKDAGNTFRESLKDGWVTTDVLTTALKGFSGEATTAELKAKGFSDVMIQEFQDLGESGIDAATKVRTFTQLMDTAQEAVGSGWSQTFRTVLGDFKEATELFTGISEAFGTFADASSDSRNEMLQTWKDLSGRTTLIDALRSAFGSLGAVLSQIGQAFRTVFPKKTGIDLVRITNNFARFVENLKPGFQQLRKIGQAFRGFFDIIKVAGTIFGEVIGFFKFMANELFGDGPGMLEYAAQFGTFLSHVRQLAIEGGGITRFFDTLKDGFRTLVRFVKDPIPYLVELKDRIVEFVKGFSLSDLNFEAPDILVGALDRLETRFKSLKELGGTLRDIWAPISDKLHGIKDVLEDVWIEVKNWFANLGDNMAEAAEPGDFNKVVDVVNLGLLGGIGALLTKLVTGGLNIDFGKGLLENITESFEELTGVMKAMQADIKANAILKIAAAVAVLSISVALLASIDSIALTKALTALAVGFGQLVTVFALVNKIALGPKSAAQFGLLAAGFILLATAMLVLAVAVKILSTLGWAELAKGLIGIAGLMVVLVKAVGPLSKNAAGMIRAGAGLLVVAVALNLLALAVRQFASMSTEELGKGLLSVATGLLIMAGAMQLMPKNLARQSVGILVIAGALNVLALAVLAFSRFSWEELGKGFAGIAGGLLGIAIALRAMPKDMTVSAGSLLLVSVALLVMARAMRKIAELSWDELAKGLLGITVALGAMVAAAYLMSGSLAGAAAITVMSGALVLMAKAVAIMGSVGLFDLVKALVGFAAVLAVVGVGAYLLAPVIPLIFGLAAGLFLLGAAFALFGVGANLTARAFKVIASAGKAGTDALIYGLTRVAEVLPEVTEAFARALLSLVYTLLEAVPVLTEQFGVILKQILVTIRDLIPEAKGLFLDLVNAMLDVIQETGPRFISTGFQMLTAFLAGVRDNIKEIVTLVADIISEFLDALGVKVPQIVESVYQFVLTVFTGVAKKLAAVAAILVPKGKAFLLGLLTGVIEKARDLKTWFTELPGNILNWLGDVTVWLLDKGKDFVSGLLRGTVDKGVAFFKWYISLPGEILKKIGSVTSYLAQKGKDLIQGLINGTTKQAGALTNYMKALPGKIKGWIGDTFTSLGVIGKNLIIGLYNGILSIVTEKIIPYLQGLPGKIIGWIGDTYTSLRTAGKNLVIGLWNGLVSMGSWLKDKLLGWAEGIVGTVLGAFGINSPSRVFADIGRGLNEGMALGLNDKQKLSTDAAEELAAALVDSFEPDIAKLERTMRAVAEVISASEGEFDDAPVIRPVLDLTDIRSGATELDNLFATGQRIQVASVSTGKANDIAQSEYHPKSDDSVTPSGPTEIRFEQNNYSPEALSVVDVYRNTKNIVTLAKDELEIS